MNSPSIAPIQWGVSYGPLEMRAQFVDRDDAATFAQLVSGRHGEATLSHRDGAPAARYLNGLLIWSAP